MDSIKHIVVLFVFSLMLAACGGGETPLTSENAGAGNQDTPAQRTTGTTTLQWIAPSTRTDNSTVSLSEIDGYRLYYGPSAMNTPDYVDIASGSTMQYTITLPAGDYFFRIRAIDSNGMEGLLSEAIRRSI